MTCCQPFRRDAQFGLSFLKFYTSETQDDITRHQQQHLSSHHQQHLSSVTLEVETAPKGSDSCRQNTFASKIFATTNVSNYKQKSNDSVSSLKVVNKICSNNNNNITNTSARSKNHIERDQSLLSRLKGDSAEESITSNRSAGKPTQKSKISIATPSSINNRFTPTNRRVDPSINDASVASSTKYNFGGHVTAASTKARQNFMDRLNSSAKKPRPSPIG